MSRELTPRETAERSLIKTYRKSIWNPFIAAVKRYELIEPGDRIAVCISGGKDSVILAKLMQELQRHTSQPFELVFMVMDPGYKPENRKLIEDNAALLGIPITIFDSDIFDVTISVEKNPCYLCARMRRGFLYAKAQELGCNKIALGHHFSDVIETTVMGLFYGGQLQAMPPKLRSKNFPGMELIRPLYCVHEDAIIAWNRRMADLVMMDELAKAIRGQVPAQTLPKRKALTKIQRHWLEKRLARADFSEKLRLHYYLGVVLEDENEIQKCFGTIQSEVLEATVRSLSYNEKAHIVKDAHTVELPLRVNWGGGWSDTPPYCNEHGGTVLNAAILLNNERPVVVKLERMDELKVVFDSRDMDVHGEFEEIGELQRTGDPFDPFALQKACLLACGIIPMKGNNLKEILERLGGGFVMHSEVTNVPKGSGLGTSSILSAACVKAVFEFMGIGYTEEDLYSHVLAMEQIMSTGGGWQDQVGGVTPGLKYITSMPGIDQKLKVVHVEIPEEARKELLW